MSRHTRRDTINGGVRESQSSGSKRHALTARGLLALPLLVALALSSLVVVAAPQPVAAAGTYFTEDFTETIGEDNQVFAGSPAVGGGVVTMPSSNNNVVRTNDNDYQTDSFCAEITVAAYVGGGDNRAYLGFGPGGLAGADGDFPQAGPAVVLRSLGQFGASFADNLTLLTSPTLGGTGTEDPNLGGLGLGAGGYRLQIGYDLFAQEVRASVDGLQFGPTVDVSGYDFTGNGRVFFAGQGVTFDDFSVQPGPCSLTPRTFTVDTTADTTLVSLPVTIDGVCDDGFGLCRLREAILEANAFGGIDTIAFDIDGDGPHTIAPREALPAITDSVIIDGYTQTDATPNTLVDGNDADIRIELAGDVINGVALDFSATDQSEVRGLAINDFLGGGSAAIRAGNGTVIDGNFIGTDVTGTTAIPNWDGIILSDAGGVTIGGADPSQRNLISGNDQSGIAVFGNSDEVSIEGNFIGTDATGNAAIPNRNGVFVAGNNSTTTTTDPEDLNQFLTIGRNVISGNSFVGVAFQGASEFSTVAGNKIGVGADGVTPLGNNPGGGEFNGGISIINWARDIQIGGNSPGAGNLIGYNANGVVAFSGINNRIVGNEFVNNEREAISLPNANTNDAGDVDSPRANSFFTHLSANYGQNSPELTRVGIAPNGDLAAEYSIDSLVTESAYPISIDFYIADSAISGEGRTRIGTAAAVAPGVGNANLGNAGLLGVGSGEAIVATATDFEGNSSPFSAVGVVDPPPTPGLIAVDDTGDAPDAVAGDGVCDTGTGACTLRAAIEESNAVPGTDTVEFDIEGAGPVTIAPATALPVITDTLVIDGYTQAGASVNTAVASATNAVAPIRLLGPGVGSGVVGLDLSGSTDSVVRGLTIGGFATGIVAGERSVIAGNFIGADGANVLGNIEGVLVDGVDDVVIGGVPAADRNLISGNGGGIAVVGDADNNLIIDNLIGPDASGTVSLANGAGIVFRARDGADTSTRDGNQIGNGFLSGRNTIAGNNGEGISIGVNTDDTEVVGNWIGVGFGPSPLGNNLTGGEGSIVVRGGTNSQIGGNRIQNNSVAVVVSSGDGNLIQGNVIGNNLGDGIVLAGTDPADPGDADGGANRGQNAPLLPAARIEGGRLIVDTAVDSAVGNAAYPVTIEYFEADSPASGEGVRPLTTFEVSGPGTTIADLGVAGGRSIASGDTLVATATDNAGNTSEFSVPVTVDSLQVVGLAGEEAGTAVAVDGNRMAVGAPAASAGSGIVYVYERETATAPWVETAVIASPDDGVIRGFGTSVDLRGDRLAVGRVGTAFAGDAPSAGRVFVFDLDAGVWVESTVAKSESAPGDRYGSSLAWIDNDALAIGAPGLLNAGRVAVAAFAAGSWTDQLLSVANSTFPAAPGDEIGFSVAFDDASGTSRLVAGAPGASRWYLWDVGGEPIGNPAVAEVGGTSNSGSAIDVSGDRVAIGGISDTDTIVVSVAELVPGQNITARANSTDIGAVLPIAPLAGPNDYLDIEGRNVVVGLNAGADGVGAYRLQDNLQLGAPVRSFVLPVTGPVYGWAVDLAGGQLTAAGPDPLGGPGAISTIRLGDIYTWTGGAGDSVWASPANWDRNAAPTAFDTAVVPTGGPSVEADAIVGRLEMASAATVSVRDGVVFESESTLIIGNGELRADPGAEIVLRNDVQLDGFIVVTGFGIEGQLVLDGDVTVTGTGELDLPGDLVKIGPGNATIDVGDAPTANGGLITGENTNISVLEGRLSVAAPDLIGGALEGEVFVAAGAVFDVDGDVALTPTSSIGVDIDGDATADNFGRIEVSGALTRDGSLFVNDNGIVDGETYEIVTYDSATGSFADLPALPAGYQTTVSATSISIEPGCVSWVGLDGGLWSTPSNWSTGLVPTASDVVCLEGTGTVVIDGSTNASVARFEIADQRIRVDTGGALTVNGLSFLEQGISVNGVLTGEGDVVLRGSSTVTGTLDGLITVDSGGTLVLAGGSTIIATATSNDVINLGAVVVTASDLLLGDDVSISNEGDWIFGLPSPQNVTAVSVASFDNRATLDLRTSDVTVDPGVTLDFGPASVLRTTIDGPSLGGDFGSLTSAGVDVTPGAELVVDRDLVAPYSPTASDVYDVLDCGATACVPFDTATLPGGLAQFVVGGDLVLAQQTVDATTFISTGFGAAWNDPANWSAGVPGPTDTAIVPADARPSIAAAESFTVGALVVAGQLFVNGALTVPASGTVDIEPTGILFAENGSTVTLGADAAIDGQFVVRSAGTVDLLDGVDITGAGILSNSGTLAVTGAVSIADPVDVDSGRESLIDIEDANFDVGTFLFDARGGLRIDSSSTATFANGLILRPSSSFVFDIAADGSVGTISTPFLGFERYSPTDDDQTFARLELAVDPGFVPAGPITLFNCSDCAANPPDPAKGVEFDEFVTGEYDVIVGRNTVDVAILENKNRSAAGGTGFGSSVSVDGDRAVVGSADGVTGPAVLERVGAVWVVVQELTNSSSVNMTLDGDAFIADGVLYEFEPDIEGFGATNVIGGTSFDLDGELALLADIGVGGFAASAQVFDRSDFSASLATVEPESLPASYGTDVALLDLGGGSALAAVSAPDTGEVYIFERVAGSWSESEVRTLTSPDGGGNQFGQSISISESALVVGEPLNDGPIGDGGAVWVYPLDGLTLADTPIKLTPSQIDGGDQFGSDVSIDGIVIVVGAGAAQKFNFPIRDGAAFVFQFDGTDWVETDALRAPDGFSFELFGDAVAVSGTDVFVGARRDRNSNGPEAGAVYDFEITPIEPAINTFIGAGVASWADPANWSSGSVPVIGEPAIVPAGTTAEVPAGAYFVGALTLGGRLQMASGGTDTTLLLGAGSVIEPTGVLAFNGSFTCFDATDPSCPSDNRLTIGGDLVVDGLLAVSATTTGSATVFSKSIPTVVLADDTSVTGDGSLFLAVPLTKSGPGTSTIGPDLDVELFGEPPRPAEDRGVLQVDEGTLDIQSAAPNGSFLPNGTIDVAPGASVSVAEDLALSPTSELGFGIDGPASSTDNFGQLQVAALTSAGTLRTTLTGYTPAFDDLYPLIACSSCTSDPVTAFDTVDIAPFTLARSADTVAVRGPELPVDLTFSLDRTSAATVRVGSSAIPVTELDRTAVVAAGGTASNVAASSVTLVGSEENAIADIELKDTLIADAILASPVLRSIPLVSIDITSEGGWSAIVAGVSELAREPLTSLTLGQVLAAGVIDDPASPAGRVGALPLGSIDVEGTPLGSIPLGSIALGATPLGSIPLEDEATGANLWCVALEGFLEPGETCDEVLLNQLTATDVALRGAPLGSIPLGSIPLGSIDVADTPLGSIPLGSIDVADSPLGSIPLGSIPLGSINVADTPLGSIGVADAPLGSIPLGSIPLGSIPLGSIPLGSIPLGSIALDDDSVASLETSLVVDPASSSVAGAPLGSIPLGSIALAQVPLGSIPLEENGVALSWCDVLADVAPEFSCTPETLASTTIAQLAVEGVPLGSIPLGSIPLGSIPLGSIDLAGTPLGSIPLGSIPLGSIPLGSIPLGSIDLAGTPLGSIPLGSIPLGSIDLAGTPLGSIPLGSIPLGSIPLGSIPLGSIPLGSIPLGSIPLGSIPLGSIPLGSIPLGSINVEGTPLGSIPLGSIPLGSIDVAGSPLGSIPLGSIPLGSIDIDCASIDCDTATLGEAVAAGAVQGDPVLGDLDGALSGIRVADLIGFVDGVSEAQLRAAIDAAGLSLADLDSLDELTLLDIPAGLLTLEGLTLADLPTQVAALLDVPLEALGDGLNLVTFADVVDAIVDPITGAPIPGVEQSLVDSIIALDLIVADLDTFGDVTLSDLFASDGSDPAITLEAIEPILGFISVESFETVFGIDLVIPDDLTIADLATADGLGDLTLADLADALGQTGDFDLADLLASLGVDILDDYTLADLLFALLGPTSRAIGGVEFAEVDAAALPAGVVPPTTLSASFQVDGSRSRTIDVAVELPAGSSFVPGSAELSVDGGDPTPTPPVVDGSQLTWTIIGQPGAAYRIDVDVLAGASIGDAEFGASASVVGTDVRRQDSATVTVEEGLEPFNFVTVDDTIAAQEDQVFFTYLSTETDVDVFEITVGQDDRIVVQLSNLDSDLDLVVWGRAGDDSPALTDTSNEAPLVAITDPDSPTIDAEPLDDFPQLDEVDPTLGIVATSNLSGTQDEALTTPRLDAGTYYVQVVGANSATNIRPAAFQIGIIEAPARPVCQPIEFGFAAGADGSSPLPADVSGIDTLILINERRLQQLYGPDARQDVIAATQRLVDGAAANAGLGISPAVVSVDAYADVRNAYTAWDSAAGSCDPNAANAVVGAINDNVIDPIRDQLDHLVILGGDELIPMARLADETTIANEYDFRNEFSGDLAGADPDGLNAFTAPFWESMIRSDEPYGDTAARSLGDRFLYVSDVALGRVVETPSEIVEALDTYLAFEGQLAIETATVLGYDFLSDGSEAIADSLEQGTTAAGAALPVDRELASGGADPGWTKEAAIEKLGDAGTRALVSLNAHFDHYRALPAIGDKDPLFTDNLLATQVAAELGTRALTQSLIFSMGCHSGLSVSDITIGATNSDWAQTLGQQGSLYVGNTGYGYGDTEAIAYTEELMLLFAEQVTNPFDVDRNGLSGSSTVGEALTWAKNQYVSGLQTFSVYDEKAVMESTFYGLPFYQVGSEPAPLPPVPVNEPVADATGTDAVETTLQETTPAAPQSTNLGVYFAGTDDDGNEEIIVAPGRPVQPKDSTDISVVDAANPSVLAQEALGAVVLEMDSTYQIVEDPLIASPTFVGGASLPEVRVASGVFPTKQVQITNSTGPAGRRQTLVVATGQYDAGTQKQRLDTDIDVVVYYADPTESDRRAPVIAGVDATVVDSVLTVELTATDAGGVDRVYLLVAEDPGDTSASAPPTVWRGLDLRRVGSSDRWTGSLNLTAGTDLVEFIVQAKDGVGNVGYATNKATNFSEPVVPPPPPPPPPPPAQLTVTTEDPLPTGWYDGDATVSVPTAASDVIFSLNGIVQERATPPATFEIVDDGVQNWTVRTVNGTSSVSGQARIDGDGDPTVVFGAPTDGSTYISGVRNLSVICADSSGADCRYSIAGVPVVPGAPLPADPGDYVLDFQATDKVGNVTSGSIGFTIEAIDAAPSIEDIAISNDTQPVGVPVTIEAPFSDASAPFDSYTATIDWGDGTITNDPIIVEPAGPSQSGSITAEHTYDTVGVYDATVTIVDGNGNPDAATVSVVVFDPDAAPVITGIDAPVGQRLITDTVVVTTRFDDASVPVDSFTATVDWGDGDGPQPVDGIIAPTPTDIGSFEASRDYAAPGTYEVTVIVTDESGNSDEERVAIEVVVPDGDPLITEVVGPNTPQSIAEPVEIAATFSDESGSFDTYTATVDWGDGSPITAADVQIDTGETVGTIAASRSYEVAGVYTVTVAIEDLAGVSDTELFEFVVVFDPETRGRVSGKGYYWSGAEARPGGSRWGAPAFFGYNARYRNNAEVPSGRTQLRLVGEFFFRSTSYDYLIVNDAIAIAEGTGRIGQDDYRFRVQGIDNGRLDFFQITIWDPDTGEVIYDNGVLYDKGDLVLLGGIRVRS